MILLALTNYIHLKLFTYIPVRLNPSNFMDVLLVEELHHRFWDMFLLITPRVQGLEHFYPSHFSGLHLQQANLRNKITSSSGKKKKHTFLTLTVKLMSFSICVYHVGTSIPWIVLSNKKEWTMIHETHCTCTVCFASLP